MRGGGRKEKLSSFDSSHSSLSPPLGVLQPSSLSVAFSRAHILTLVLGFPPLSYPPLRQRWNEPVQVHLPGNRRLLLSPRKAHSSRQLAEVYPSGWKAQRLVAQLNGLSPLGVQKLTIFAVETDLEDVGLDTYHQFVPLLLRLFCSMLS